MPELAERLPNSKNFVPWNLAIQVIYQIHTKLSVLH